MEQQHNKRAKQDTNNEDCQKKLFINTENSSEKENNY